MSNAVGSFRGGSDGVIKFECRWERRDCISEEMLEELRPARLKMKRLGLVGAGSDGVGYGNISVRRHIPGVTALDSPGQRGFIITGSQTGHLDDPGPEAYSYVFGWDLGANRLDCAGPAKASSESLTHAALYDLSPEIAAVIHVHSHALWTQWTDSAARTSESATYGTPEMAEEMKRVFREGKMGGKGSICMGGHPDGIIAWGTSMDEVLRVIVGLL